ncbi:MAG: WD40 repeat domain-containing protein [Pontiellaceae bacterium]
MKIILLTLIMIAPITFGSYLQLGSDINGEAGGDQSGSSVALSSDGSIVAIGAYGNDGNGSYSGHVRLYQWNGSSWNQLGSDIDGEASNDRSGYSVALSSDGSIVAIGAHQNDGNGRGVGHVRLYQWDGASWNQLGSDIDGEAEFDRSGSSVALSSDGSIVAIGAPSNTSENGGDSGHVRLYKWDGSSWNQLGSDIDGKDQADYSGNSISLSADGTVIAIGASWSYGGGSYDAGRVSLYQWDGSSWNQLGDNIDGDNAYANSGKSVALSSDGSIVAIGAPTYNLYGENESYSQPGEGQVRLYQWDGSSWNQLGNDIDGETPTEGFGTSVALSSDGYIVVIGANRKNIGVNSNNGQVRSYQWDGSSWNQLGNDINGEAQDDEFGTSIALSSDGSIIAIGAPFNDATVSNSGHVRIFKDATSEPILNLDIFYEAQSNQTIEINATLIAGYPTNFTYQWILNGYHIPSLYGGTASSYTITGNSSYDGDWNVIVSNDIGSTTNDFVFQTFSDDDGDGLSDGRETYITFTNPNNMDSDGDTINDGDEINIYQTDPNDLDSDDDRFDDGTEIVRGFNPTTADSWIAEYINTNPSDFSSLTTGGILLNQVKDLRIGSQTFGVSNGNAKIRMFVDESSDLTSTWSNAQHVLELDIPADADTKFYRFRMD